MRGIHFSQGSLTLKETPKPTDPGPNDVIIRIIYCGICGSDLLIINHMPSFTDGVILGHEIVGVVDSIGNNVTNIAVGDKVVVNPGYFCGSCVWCLKGELSSCEPGAMRDFIGVVKDGGWADYVKVLAKQVHKIPEGMSLKQACLTEPFSCVMHAWKRCPVPSNSRVLVLRGGMIGLLFCWLFKHCGFRNVTLTEVAEGRRKIALTCGLDFKVCQPDQIANELKNPHMAERTGFDLIVDTTGQPLALEEALNWLRRGGKYSLFGVVPENETARIKSFQLLSRQNTIITAMLSGTSFQPSIEILHDMYKSGMDIEKLGVQIFPLENYRDALNKLDEYTITKAMLQASLVE